MEIAWSLEQIVVFMAAGLFGGFVRALVTGKGMIMLPKIEHVDGGSPHLNLGFLAPMIIGAGAGLLGPYAFGVNGVLSFLSGYAGTDLLENVVERTFKKP